MAKQYIKNYFKHHNLAEDETPLCKICNTVAHDIHHIDMRSSLGSDEVDNLIALCRKCHDRAHFKTEPYLTKEELFKKL